MFCSNCGQEIANNAAFCPNCGKVWAAQATAPAIVTPPFAPSQPAPIYYQQAAPLPMRRKKSHGCLITFLVIIMLLAAGAAAVYFLVPGLFRPRNLGIPSTQAAYESAIRKMDFLKDDAPENGSKKDYKYVFGPVKKVNTSLSNEEITSFFNINRPPYFPLKNVQVRVANSSALQEDQDPHNYSLSIKPSPAVTSGDIPLELSFMITRDYILNDLLSGSVSQTELEEGLKSIGFGVIIPSEINFYAKMSGSIQNNRVTNLRIYSASIMGIPIPSDLIQSDDVSSLVSEIINALLDNYKTESGANFIVIQTEAGAIRLEGMIPSSLIRTPIK